MFFSRWCVSKSTCELGLTPPRLLPLVYLGFVGSIPASFSSKEIPLPDCLHDLDLLLNFLELCFQFLSVWIVLWPRMARTVSPGAAVYRTLAGRELSHQLFMTGHNICDKDKAAHMS